MLYFCSLCQTSHQSPPELEWIHPKGGNLSRLLGLRLRLPHPRSTLEREMGALMSVCQPWFPDEGNVDN